MVLEIIYVNNAAEAERLKDKGYEPVECSFGKNSVVGKLGLDHHGQYSKEIPVSLKSAKIALQPRFSPLYKFVVTGMPDPDVVYAILALSKSITPDLEIARAIAELDIDPIGVDRSKEPYLRVAAFEMEYLPYLSLDGHLRALDIGKSVFDAEGLDKVVADNALKYEKKRLKNAHTEIEFVDGDVAFAVSDRPNRDVWHQHASVVVQYKPKLKVLTFSALSRRAARLLGKRSEYDIFGRQGLGKVYNSLDDVIGEGSGGRETIGGSPRGVKINMRKALEVHERISMLTNQA